MGLCYLRFGISFEDWKKSNINFSFSQCIMSERLQYLENRNVVTYIKSNLFCYLEIGILFKSQVTNPNSFYRILRLYTNLHNFSKIFL